MILLWQILWSFCKIGATTFGGGYAMLPILQREITQRRGWTTEEELIDYYSVSQGLPGLIAVNTAVFIGNKKRGVAGAAAAALGIALPSLVVIVLIAALLTQYWENEYVSYAFSGVRVVVGVLILRAIIQIWKAGIKDAFGVVLFAAAFIASAMTDISPILVVLAAALAGIGFLRLRKRGGK